MSIFTFFENSTTLFTSKEEHPKNRIMKEYKGEKERMKFVESFINGYYETKGKAYAKKMVDSILTGSMYRADPFYYMNHLTDDDYYMLSIAEYLNNNGEALDPRILTNKFIKRLNKASNFLGYGDVVIISEEELEDVDREVLDPFTAGLVQAEYPDEETKELFEYDRKCRKKINDYYAKELAKYDKIKVDVDFDEKDDDKKAKKSKKKDKKAKKNKDENIVDDVKVEEPKAEEKENIKEAMKRYPNARSQALNHPNGVKKATNKKATTNTTTTTAVAVVVDSNNNSSDSGNGSGDSGSSSDSGGGDPDPARSEQSNKSTEDTKVQQAPVVNNTQAEKPIDLNEHVPVEDIINNAVDALRNISSEDELKSLLAESEKAKQQFIAANVDKSGKQEAKPVENNKAVTVNNRQASSEIKVEKPTIEVEPVENAPQLTEEQKAFNKQVDDATAEIKNVVAEAKEAAKQTMHDQYVADRKSLEEKYAVRFTTKEIGDRTDEQLIRDTFDALAKNIPGMKFTVTPVKEIEDLYKLDVAQEEEFGVTYLGSYEVFGRSVYGKGVPVIKGRIAGPNNTVFYDYIPIKNDQALRQFIFASAVLKGVCAKVKNINGEYITFPYAADPALVGTLHFAICKDIKLFDFLDLQDVSFNSDKEARQFLHVASQALSAYTAQVGITDNPYGKLPIFRVANYKHPTKFNLVADQIAFNRKHTFSVLLDKDLKQTNLNAVAATNTGIEVRGNKLVVIEPGSKTKYNLEIKL